MDRDDELLKVLSDPREHRMLLSALAEIETMRQLEVHQSLAPHELDAATLESLHKTIRNDILSQLRDIASTGVHKETELPTGPTPQGNIMRPGEVLMPGQGISSQDGRYTLAYQPNGDLEFIWNWRTRLTPSPQVVWSSGTAGRPGACVLEEDGNLLICDGEGKPIWSSGTWQHPGSRLVVEYDGTRDGRVVIYHPDDIPVWVIPNWFLGSVITLHVPGNTPEVTVKIGSYHKILCGGARVNTQTFDLALTTSYPKDAQTWIVRTSPEASAVAPATIDVCLLAVQDPNNEFKVDIFPSSEEAPGYPAIATVGEGYVLTGGGGASGNALTASYPADPVGPEDPLVSWVAEDSTTNVSFPPSKHTAYAIGIKAQDGAPNSLKRMFERRMFETKKFTRTVVPVQFSIEGKGLYQASAEIAPDEGYVLVGGGVRGSLFHSAVYPDNGKWKIDSKGVLGNPITVYAIGARIGRSKLR